MANWVLIYIGLLQVHPLLSCIDVITLCCMNSAILLHPQCIGVGWLYKIERQYRRVGKVAVIWFDCGCFTAVLVPTVVGKRITVTCYLSLALP